MRLRATHVVAEHSSGCVVEAMSESGRTTDRFSRRASQLSGTSEGTDPNLRPCRGDQIGGNLVLQCSEYGLY